MKILLVSRSMQDADPIGRVLSRLMPGLELEVSDDIQDAMLRSANGVDAVLLDQRSDDGDAIALIKAIRGENRPAAVVVMVGQNDFDSAVKMMGAGADDYVLKRNGYVESLPVILVRASAKYAAAVGAGGSSKSLYANKAADMAGRFAQSPLRRDITGATRVLIKNTEIEASADYPHEPDILEESLHRAQRSLQDAQTSLAGQAMVLQTEREQRKSERDGFKKQLDLLETKCNALQEELRRQKGESAAEREQWDRRRMALERQLEVVEQSRATLEQAVLQEEARQENLARQHAAEILQWENARKELEQQRSALELRIGQLEEFSAKLGAEHRESLAQAEKLRLESEDRLKQVVEKHTSERMLWESVRKELEERNKSLGEQVRVGLERLSADLGSLQTLSRETSDRCWTLLKNVQELPESHDEDAL